MELSEWRKQHSNKNHYHHNHHKNNSKNEIDKYLHENSKNDNNNEKLNYNLFKIASRQLESTYTLSLDIQERYGISTNTW